VEWLLLPLAGILRAMSQEKVPPELRALAEATYDALNAGDIDCFLALMTEDVEFTSLIAEAEGASFRGVLERLMEEEGEVAVPTDR